ncbi:MAG: AAA family ATPase [Okeania sp. SIO3I5]|uniref:NB-ARC domain-containing protein n=1 Tax=Okeania sp. SIO3I5 TaxID=2607805 RepID=UPI0013BCCA1B|nr:NB-ARC domain-containing protein [Okeania sp. SIO3I5]NEQ35863.1 AAA family ATPase [Okeania sp. SIO3I5]
MSLEEALKIADKIVFEKTGQHLDDLQKAVLQGTLKRKRYRQIAEDFDYSESCIRGVGAELWKIISEELGEDVNKSNFRSAMERFHNSNILNFAENVSGSFNICEKERHSLDTLNSHQPNQQTPHPTQPATRHQDLDEMPELGDFYNRTTELETLTTWISEQHCRLIALTGIIGIGKTTLAVKLVQQIKDNFDYVIWRSLETSPTFAEFQADLVHLFSQSQPQNSLENRQKPLPLIKYLQKHRCLVVLDDIHHLFSSRELAGKYKPGYEEYDSFFKQIEKLSHQSCLLLIGWEQPIKLLQLKSKKIPIPILQLTGLDVASAREILRDYGLTEIDNSEKLIHLYQGNPSWLKSVATQIQELEENLIELLPDDAILLPEDLKDNLQQQSDRLSQPEKQTLSLLATKNQPISLAQLLETTQTSPSDLLNTLQSLYRRSLIEKQENLYSVPRVLREYYIESN